MTMWRRLHFKRRHGNAILMWTIKWEEDGVRTEDFDYLKELICNAIDNVKNDPHYRHITKGCHQPDGYMPEYQGLDLHHPPKGYKI